MERLKNNRHFLSAFGNLSRKQCVLLIENITQEQAIIISDIAANVLAGTLSLSTQNKERLSKHKDFIRCLGSSNNTHIAKRRCITKHPKSVLLLIEITKDKVLRLVRASEV